MRCNQEIYNTETGMSHSECLTCVESVEEDECECSTEVIDSREMARISQVLSVCAVREIGEEICNL